MAGETFRTTIDESVLITDEHEKPIPGLVKIFSGGKPQCLPIRLDSGPVVLGRFSAEGLTGLDDERVSRRHTGVELRGDAVRVTDLGSRNGTYVDGVVVKDQTYAKWPRILRLGQSLLLFVADLRAFIKGGVEVTADEVVGPTLRKSRLEIQRAAEAGDSMLLTGPSGSGKELAARAFHEASGAKRDFVAVNCATIQAGVAERLLFGAKKGTYSGATQDADGYVQTADGGTLFLDEIAELEVSVQPKLLRVLENHEVMPLGASLPRKVDVRVCCATLKDLRSEVQSGRFREDLYFRISVPEVRLPALIERLEDVPWLIERELHKVDARLSPHPFLIEACALRAWPGNVRELLREVKHAGRAALADNRTVVKDRDLSETAGREMGEPRASTPTTPAATTGDLSREAIEAALRHQNGNVTRAAKELGLHRNQLRRWLGKHGVDPHAFGSGDDDVSVSGNDGNDPPPEE
jgi:transcriptional regulator of acetoin/glycerol metabolism